MAAWFGLELQPKATVFVYPGSHLLRLVPSLEQCRKPSSMRNGKYLAFASRQTYTQAAAETVTYQLGLALGLERCEKWHSRIIFAALLCLASALLA